MRNLRSERIGQLQLFCAWCGIAYAVVFGLGYWPIAQVLVPPHSPLVGSEETLAILEAKYFRIRIGMVLGLMGAILYVPFTALIAQCISEIEGGFGILTFSQIMGGIGTSILTVYPAITWIMTGLDFDRAVEITYQVNDAAWLQLVGGLTPFLLAPITIAIASFIDKSDIRYFPRWVGYYNIWSVLLLLPGQLIFFFLHGPFAWNGIIGFWLPLVALGCWFLVVFIPLRDAIIKRNEKTGLLPSRNRTDSMEYTKI